MNSFLTKISQLSSIGKVLFLSARGDVLFASDSQERDEIDGQVSRWQGIIEGLHSPMEAELFFDRGSYYLHWTEIGYVIIGINGQERLSSIKAACAQLQIKLGDPIICKKVLLRMLQEAEDDQKLKFVMSLLPYADAEIADRLIVILDPGTHGASPVGIKLLAGICQVLGQSRSSAARQTLKTILREHYSGKTLLPDELRHAAQVAVAQLDMALPPEPGPGAQHGKILVPAEPVKKQPAESARAAAAREPLPAAAVTPSTANLPEGVRIAELLQRGDKGQAIALMLTQIDSCARRHQFDMAEQLREWLIQADSTSLREIIRAADIIEEQKNAAINEGYRAVWSKLAEVLSAEEFSSLYHKLSRKHYPNNEIIVDQGQFFSALFFIDSGRVQLFSARAGGECVVKSLEAGAVFGAETFFDISIWTMSARSMGADIAILTWDRLLQLKESNPALRAKLMDFCGQFKVAPVAFKKAGNTRRRFERIKLSGRVAVALPKKTSEDSHFSSRGNLIDISRGGLAFSLRFSKRKNAVALLGREVSCTVTTDSSARSLERNGIVKAVLCHDYVGSDYTIHLEFKDTLSNAEVAAVSGRSR